MHPFILRALNSPIISLNFCWFSVQHCYSILHLATNLTSLQMESYTVSLVLCSIAPWSYQTYYIWPSLTMTNPNKFSSSKFPAFTTFPFENFDNDSASVTHIPFFLHFYIEPLLPSFALHFYLPFAFFLLFNLCFFPILPFHHLPLEARFHPESWESGEFPATEGSGG